MTDWPVGLPQRPTRDGWSRENVDNVARYPVEVGSPKRRRRSTVSDYIVRANFEMTLEQLATFWTFYKDTLADGTLPFRMLDPVTETMMDFEFEEPPRESYIAVTIWQVSLTLRQPA